MEAPPPYPSAPAPPPVEQPGQRVVYVQTNGIAVAQPVGVQPGVVAVVQGLGNCPNCRIGNIQEGYSICGIALAILFFPWGLICCLMMKERRCSHCLVYF